MILTETKHRYLLCYTRLPRAEEIYAPKLAHSILPGGAQDWPEAYCY